MNTGRINSDESIRLASRLVHAFGDWDAVERAATRDIDGVYVIRRSDLEARERANGRDH